MLTLETAIQKIQRFPQEQRNKVIEYIEFLEFQAHRQQEKQPETSLEQKQDFFSLAGIWEGKNITLDNIRKDAWGEKNVEKTREDVDDTPDDIIIEGIKQGFKEAMEAMSGQTIPLSQMWEGIDNG